jgi:TAT (twin-arginine translocation) pathway signal sequence
MNDEHTTPPQGSEEHSIRSTTRRTFLKGAAVVAAAAGIGTAVGFEGTPASAATQAAPAEGGASDTILGPLSPRQRAQTALLIKRQNARFQFRKPIPDHRNNGDESRFPNMVGQFHKGLPHNGFGEVDLDAYRALILALSTGEYSDFERIPLAGTARLVNPQASLAFDTEGVDSHQLTMPPAHALDSAERAGEAVELYWMALARDVPFTQYGEEPITQGAIADLNRVSAFPGVRPVTAANLFRLGLGGEQFSDLIGPFMSQFLLIPFNEGVIPIDHKIRTYRSLSDGGRDFLTDVSSWLAAENGQVTIDASAVVDPEFRHVRSGRDLAQYVHIDVVYQLNQQYVNAESILVGEGAEIPAGIPSAPLSPTNPYRTSRTQEGFPTLGAGFIVAMLGEVARRALQAQWVQKWLVHRNLRPEAFGGLVHFQKTQGRYPFLHRDILDSPALPLVFQQNGTYLLPQTFPEGSPLHPAYASGHATIAGACATLLKAFFDETTKITSLFTPQVPTPDGLSLVPYTGADADQMTVGSELNKLASNESRGRHIAGVHWHSDGVEAMLLGEQVAIALLQDVKQTLNEFRTGGFTQFTFHDFQGNVVNI